MLLDSSTTNRDSETVQRKWLWPILIVYLVVLVVLAVFIILYFTYNANELQSELDSVKSENDNLAIKCLTLTQNIVTLDANNTQLSIQAQNLTQTNTNLVATIQSTIDSINTTTSSTIPLYTNLRLISMIVGGISVVANLGVVPYAMYQNIEYNTLAADVTYLHNRFMVGAQHKVEALMSAAAGRNVNLTLINNFTSIPSKSDFYTKAAGYTNTVTIIYTTNNEAIALVLHQPWSTSLSYIDDTSSYTISVRNMGTCSILSGIHAVDTTASFLSFGNGEIVVSSSGSGTASTNTGYRPDDTTSSTNSDFYAEGGSFTLSYISVYSWTTSS